MNVRVLGRFVGKILLLEIAFMVPALLISVTHGEWEAARGFLISMCIVAVIAGIFLLIGRGSEKKFFAREGMACVGISWIAFSFLGCLPFYFSGAIPGFLDALFESVSGFTTTGASVLSDIESMPMGILYWRSFGNWVGGMGVLVFLLAISSASGGDNGFTMHLLRAESPGPNVGKLVPKMKQTASILYIIYMVLTALNLIFLLCGGMPFFDALCTAFGTVGTGGFGIKNDSMASYNAYVQGVCTVFMFLSGINFTCYYLILVRRIGSVLRDEELRMYLVLTVGSIALIFWNLKDTYASGLETFRHAAFQIVSLLTTAGFATTDYEMWPSFSKAILMALMVIGACAGSTGGGVKCGRVLLMLKTLRRSVHRIVHPAKIQVVTSNGNKMDEKVLANVNAYLAAYVIILAGSILVISLDNFSFTTNFSAVLACFNNVGFGFDMVGPTGNYAAYGALSKLVLIFDMLAGRLEIFPILVLLSRSTWAHR